MTEEEIACPECGTEVLSHNLDRHYRRQHPGLPQSGKAEPSASSGLVVLVSLAAILVVVVAVVVGTSWYLATTDGGGGNGDDGCCSVGDEPPRFTGLDTDGIRFSLGSHLGIRPLVIEWIWTDCPHCQATAPLMNQAANEFGGQITFVALAGDRRDDAEKVRDFTRDFASTFPHLKVSSDLQRDYGVTGFPTTFFIGSDGIIKSLHSGEFNSYADLSATLRTLS